jgi:large subunit ribosomal protein L10
LVFAAKESPAVAKVLQTFSKDNASLRLIGCCFESHVFDRDAIIRIAQLPPKEVLLAQVCGTIQAPVVSLVNVLNVMILRLLWVLQETHNKKQQQNN